MKEPTDSEHAGASVNLDILMERMRRAEAAVQGEYEESDRRLNWFLLFHAFLFGTYATCLQGLLGGQGAGMDQEFTRRFLTLIALVALITAACTAVATHAALAAIVITKNARDQIEELAVAYGFEKTLFPVKHRLHALGLWPTRVTPYLLLASWTIVLVTSLAYGVARVAFM